MATLRVLIVEDEMLIAEDIRGRLVRMNYEVVGLTDSGKEALRLAETLRPDLVLMDIGLNGSMDGLEAGHLIEESIGAAILYVTSDPRASDLPHSLHKPFATAALASGIAKALR